MTNPVVERLSLKETVGPANGRSVEGLPSCATNPSVQQRRSATTSTTFIPVYRVSLYRHARELTPGLLEEASIRGGGN
jgi:hypothetical protein